MLEFFGAVVVWIFGNFLYLCCNDFKIKEYDQGILMFCNLPFITCFIVAIGNWLH